MAQVPPDFKPTPIASLVPMMNSVNCHFIVTERTPSVGFRTNLGEFSSVKVADPSGSVNLNFLTAEYGDCLMPGDIVRLRNGHTTIFKGCMSLACGKNGELNKTAEFIMAYSDTPNMSEFSAEFATQYPPPKRPEFGQTDELPQIGGPPRNNAQPLMNLLPPGGPTPVPSIPRDPRSKRPFQDTRHY